MEQDKNFIGENDSIYDVVTKHPEVKARLLELSKKYERLNNPAIFNTVAKITTVKKAASIGGLYWKEFLYQLNDSIGLGKEYLEKSKSDAFAAHGKPVPDHSAAPVPGKKSRAPWMDQAKDFVVMDVRDGGEPFFIVTEKAKTIKSGQGFILVQVFEPQPLISLLESMGFEHETIKAGDAEFRIHFYKK